MQSISLADTVTLEKHSGLVVQTGRSDLPGDSSNLAYKAAMLMAERFNKTPDVKITLDKHIFMAAGLAGGSSDAAAVLRGLNRLWQLGLNAAQLEELAAEIGSDVPFCICGGTALAEGRGEILTPLPEPQEAVIVLAKPQQAVSTAWVYKEFDTLKEPQHPDIGTLKAALLKGNAVLPLPGMGNARRSAVRAYERQRADCVCRCRQHTGSTENYRSIAGMETGNSDCHNCEKECNINERTFKPYSA